MGVFVMPSLGADMEDGTLVEWAIAEGDTVARGDVVAVIETQKGAIEIECFEAGPVSKLLASVGEVVPVGAPLAMIGAGVLSEPKPEPVSQPDAAPAHATGHEPERSGPHPAVAVPEVQGIGTTTPTSPSALDPTIAFIPSTSDQPRATPAARLRARDLKIDLVRIPGTGPDGVIVLGDVERQTEARSKTTQPARPTSKDPRDEMRKAIAAAMVRSKQTIPHFYLSQTIDAQPAMDHLAALNADRPPADRLLLGAFVMRAAAIAARACPSMNGHYENGRFQPASEVHLGLAIALRSGGLVAPAVMHADTLGLDDTMAAMRDLVARARAGRLRGTEMTAGTLTLSSLGESGAEAMGGVIFPPQVALAGLGAPKIRSWVVDGKVRPRSVVNLTVSVDHRVNDGRQASRFLAAFEAQMMSPEEL